MTYEAWRITYQSSEQAARAAYDVAENLRIQLQVITQQSDSIKTQESTGSGINGYLQAKIDLALDALSFDAGTWSDESRERHLLEQIALAKQHLIK